jgi:hypothetical protein
MFPSNALRACEKTVIECHYVSPYCKTSSLLYLNSLSSLPKPSTYKDFSDTSIGHAMPLHYVLKYDGIF